MNQPLGWFFVWDREKKEDLLLVKKIRAETGRIKGGVRAQKEGVRAEQGRNRAETLGSILKIKKAVTIDDEPMHREVIHYRKEKRHIKFTY